MKVKEYFKELSDVLNAYTFGDLFEAMQAVELCDQFITENEIPEEELAQIRLLKSLLESIILQGSSDEQEAELLRIKTALLEGTAAEAAPAVYAHGTPAAEEPQTPTVTADDLLAQMGGAEPKPADDFARLLSQMNDAADNDTQQQDIDSLLSQMQPPQDEAPAPEAESAVQKQETPTGPKPGEMLTITVDDGETLNSFVAESTEHLDNVENLIVNLEATHDRDTVNAIFRAMHTIKGISGFMGFSQITQLSHRLENLLDALRSNAIDFSSELIDILLSGSDILRSMMNVLAPVAARYAASEDSFAVEFPVYDLSSILNDIERYMAAHECGAENSTPSEPAKNEEIPQQQPAAEPAFSSPMLTARELGEYAYAAKKVFENLKRSLTILQQDIRNETAMRKIVTEIKALHDASLKTGVHEIIDLCELITNKINRVSDGYTLSYSDLFSSLKTLADAFKARMALLKQAAGEELPPLEEEKNEEADKAAPISPVQPQPFQMPTAEPQTERPQSEAVRSTAAVQPELPKAKEGDAPQKTVSAAAAAADPEATTVRVDIKKMDRLFNMIGELITAQDILMGQFDEEDESQEIQKAKNNLENVTREIQELSMQLRMITLNGLFNKMKRLVRDLSRKLQKEINFTIFGQDTEMDRNVIDEISDPLMHIIRNALDHGIETAAERTAAGKPPAGNVTLGAKYEGNSIVISVRDDGRGLDKAKIKEKAIRKGIITSEEAANLPARKIFDLTMLPGFSTSETVSDISGRGVGMDVVKRSIDALRGSVIIRSEEGKGSEFLIRIPLTLAIIDAITFKLGELTFATQITDVVEFYKFREEQVTVTQSQGEVLNLRGELIPILEMSRCYGTDHHYQRYEDGIAIIAASSNDKKVAVVVDEIIGNKHLVIKPLPQMFAHLSSLSGCSILAGGETCLIVDMNRLLGETLDLV